MMPLPPRRRETREKELRELRDATMQYGDANEVLNSRAVEVSENRTSSLPQSRRRGVTVKAAPPFRLPFFLTLVLIPTCMTHQVRLERVFVEVSSIHRPAFPLPTCR